MITITLDEYVNGFGVRIYDIKDGYIINETQDEKLHALRLIERWVQEEMVRELETRVQASGGIL